MWVWLFPCKYPVTPPSYIKLVIVVYRQRLRILYIWYNFQACCLAGYRDITPGSELSDHSSYKFILTLFAFLLIFLLKIVDYEKKLYSFK